MQERTCAEARRSTCRVIGSLIAVTGNYVIARVARICRIVYAKLRVVKSVVSLYPEFECFGFLDFDIFDEQTSKLNWLGLFKKFRPAFSQVRPCGATNREGLSSRGPTVVPEPFEPGNNRWGCRCRNYIGIRTRP